MLSPNGSLDSADSTDSTDSADGLGQGENCASSSLTRAALDKVSSFTVWGFKPLQFFSGLLGILILAGGTTLALSSMSPPKPDVTQRELAELLTPPSLATQLAPVLDAGQELHLFRADSTRSSDTVESLFLRLGIDDSQAALFIRSNPVLRRNLLNFSARPVRVEVDSQNKLLSLKVLWTSARNQFTTLEIERRAKAVDEGSSSNAQNASLNTDQGFGTSELRAKPSTRAGAYTNSGKLFTLKQSTSPLHSSVRYASAVIQTSLFAATDTAQIPDSVAAQLAEVFASDIDFHRTLQKGDHFSLLYEALDADGEFMGYGKLLGAEFVSAGVAHHAIYFKERGAKEGSYFNLKGQSLRRPYLAAPLRFSRITSGYKMRFHPILQTWKAHKGIDYAAPTGTPVHTVGKGVIRTAGFLNGLGNVVFVDHGNAQTTVYAHLSAIKVRVGQSVEQGELIGLVGETGWATGPHLHFEFRIHDQYRDPSTIARQSTTTQLSAQAKAEFDQQAASFLAQLGRNSGTNDAVALAQ